MTTLKEEINFLKELINCDPEKMKYSFLWDTSINKVSHLLYY